MHLQHFQDLLTIYNDEGSCCVLFIIRWVSYSEIGVFNQTKVYFRYMTHLITTQKSLSEVGNGFDVCLGGHEKHLCSSLFTATKTTIRWRAEFFSVHKINIKCEL